MYRRGGSNGDGTISGSNGDGTISVRPTRSLIRPGRGPGLRLPSDRRVRGARRAGRLRGGSGTSRAGGVRIARTGPLRTREEGWEPNPFSGPDPLAEPFAAAR